MSKNYIIVKASKSTYKIDFQTDTTDIWAIFSKFTGQIIDAELTNVDSYKIDGVTVTLPFTVEFDRTYLIEIVKTNPNLVFDSPTLISKTFLFPVREESK